MRRRSQKILGKKKTVISFGKFVNFFKKTTAITYSFVMQERMGKILAIVALKQ